LLLRGVTDGILCARVYVSKIHRIVC